MNALDTLLADLIDYAGLYPPASLDMHSAVRNYLEYSRGPQKRALGRFVLDLDRFPYLWDAAGDYVRGIRLSVLAGPESDWDDLRRLIEKGYLIETIDIRASAADEIHRLARRVPDGLIAYFEIPIDSPPETLAAIDAEGARVKLRMGGLSAEAFPSTHTIARMLEQISRRRMLFKATAGLHHPVRAKYPLTSAPNSPTVPMHGFINLATAAAVLHFGGDVADAFEALEELEPGAWRITPNAIVWREHGWNADELCEIRRLFFAALGSCSFHDPFQELEALAWL